MGDVIKFNPEEQKNRIRKDSELLSKGAEISNEGVLKLTTEEQEAEARVAMYAERALDALLENGILMNDLETIERALDGHIEILEDDYKGVQGVTDRIEAERRALGKLQRLLMARGEVDSTFDGKDDPERWKKYRGRHAAHDDWETVRQNAEK